MFKQQLMKHRLYHLLDDYDFNIPCPFNCSEAVKLIVKAMQEGKKIFVKIDEDCDGYLGGLGIKYLFDALNYSNFYIGRIRNKTHGITLDDCRYIIENDFDVVIIVDSSSNEMNTFKLLETYNKQVIVLDHHEMDYDYAEYPSNTIVVNPRGEFDVDYSDISGTFVAFLFSYWTLKEFQLHSVENWAPIFVLGYITIYSDSCNLRNLYNVSILKNIGTYARYVPKEIRRFMSQYDALNRSFVLFKLAPRINAQIRTGNFDTLHNYLFLGQNVFDAIERNYQFSKEVTKLLELNIPVTTYRHFYVADFDRLPQQYINAYRDILRNFTGLVANSLTMRYGKPVITLITEGEGFYGGSVREPLNRNILKLFKPMMQCGGHPQAFGFRFEKAIREGFLNYLDTMLGKIDYQQQINIVVDLDKDIYRNPLTDTAVMAEYNELSGSGIPVAMFKKQVSYDMDIDVKDNYTLVKWNGMYIACFTDVYYGDKMLIQPTQKKQGVGYIVRVTI